LSRFEGASVKNKPEGWTGPNSFTITSDKETSKLVGKLVLLILLVGSAVVMTVPAEPQLTNTQCVPELGARKIAENSPLPEYPEEKEPGSSAGLVFVAVEFGTDGKFSKMKMHETPGPQVTEAVKTALEKWKLRELFDGGGQPIKTRTALKFHFVFEDGKGRVDVATEQEQLEFGGQWSKPVCRVNFDE
jgi:hypothetical protein